MLILVKFNICPMSALPNFLCWVRHCSQLHASLLENKSFSVACVSQLGGGPQMRQRMMLLLSVITMLVQHHRYLHLVRLTSAMSCIWDCKILFRTVYTLFTEWGVWNKRRIEFLGEVSLRGAAVAAISLRIPPSTLYCWSLSTCNQTWAQQMASV